LATYTGHQAAATTQFALTEGAAAVFLAVVVTAVGRAGSRAGGGRAARITMAAGLVAVVISLAQCALAQCALGVYLTSSVVPAGHAAAAGDLADAISRLLTVAAVGRSGRDALHAIAAAYRSYAALHPALCAASVRAPAADDAEHIAAGIDAVAVLRAALDDYGIAGDDVIHAIRYLRVALHGFVTLEAAGGFGLPQSVDVTFQRLIDALDVAFSSRGEPAGLA
jgi:hypothetical protein